MQKCGHSPKTHFKINFRNITFHLPLFAPLQVIIHDFPDLVILIEHFITFETIRNFLRAFVYRVIYTGVMIPERGHLR